MYGQATIVLDTHHDAITIPSSAIVDLFVDRQGDLLPGCRWPRRPDPDHLGWDDGQHVEVLDGLKLGDVVVVKSVDTSQGRPGDRAGEVVRSGDRPRPAAE